jgi:hypothetical protein
MPRSAADCLRMAKEAIDTGDHAENDAQRNVMLNLAQQWMRLAEHVEDCDRITSEKPKPC